MVGYFLTFKYSLKFLKEIRFSTLNFTNSTTNYKFRESRGGSIEIETRESRLLYRPLVINIFKQVIIGKVQSFPFTVKSNIF
jgi:hypothetical protein